MLFDPQSKKPLFRLAYDQVGASQALDVAREHGLPDSILRRAEQYLLQDGQETGQVLQRLNDLAARREEELRDLKKAQDKARREAEHAREKFEKERLRLHDEVRAQAQELMRAWKEGRATQKQALREMSRLRASLAAVPQTEEAPAAPQPVAEIFRVGQEVLHTAFNKRGRITDIDERRNRLRLDLNGVSLWAAAKDVRLPATATPTAAPSAVGRAVRAQTDDSAPALKLDLRGMRADQALAEVERFLDKALLAGFHELEVVHGRGTGALRRQIHDFLRGFPAVEHFALAPEDRGGDGMTIVQLR